MENKDYLRILGPCSVQDQKTYLDIAEILVRQMKNYNNWYYKASFDKANRTSIYGGRGPGLEESIELFYKVKEKYPNIKLTTDIHEPWQAEKLKGLIDAVQIPAFLCKQTDLLIASAENFDKVNIKKGQWVGPDTLLISVDKIKSTNPNAEAWICDRGSNFGYDKLITDLTIVDELKTVYDKVILDCTHSTQRSRKVYGTQGDPILAERHFIGAPIYNYDGIFAEVHTNPKSSPSDGDCMIKVEKLDLLLEKQEKVLEL